MGRCDTWFVTVLCSALALGAVVPDRVVLGQQKVVPAAELPLEAIATGRAALETALAPLLKVDVSDQHLADIAVCAKAADWIVRHHEFHDAKLGPQTLAVLELGLARAKALAAGPVKWDQTPGKHALGYQSLIEGSYQPYLVTIPAGHDVGEPKRWPLHLVLHGRNDTLTEVAFIAGGDGKPAPKEQDWIQLDVYGRGNNAYRWAGETDVFEALADVRRRYRIDDRRIVLHGFSMGGAGAWHLGLHHPSLWCSVGPGAGFVDFYKYTKTAQPLPETQDKTLHIYNAVDYALNAGNVPVVTYGGELDPQLTASTTMKAAAEQQGVPIELIVGPGMGHKFDPESLAKFMAFHRERQTAGRPTYAATTQLKFVTWTLKYNQCAWIHVEEMIRPYEPCLIEAVVDGEKNVLRIKTRNCAVLQVDRELATDVEIDGVTLPLFEAAEGLLPGVYYETSGETWRVLSYDRSLGFTKNVDLRKRHNLQGPIDDAFMQPFVCVVGTGEPWHAGQAAWSQQSLKQLEGEFDKWMRGKVRVLKDSEVTAELIADNNLILFGDPKSNSVLGTVLARLPVKWTAEKLTVGDETYDPATHAVQMIHPNPQNPRRYVVINSGHTFHEAEFRKSNAWLIPMRGDLAVVRFEAQGDTIRETVVRSEILTNQWRLPGKK